MGCSAVTARNADDDDDDELPRDFFAVLKNMSCWRSEKREEEGLLTAAAERGKERFASSLPLQWMAVAEDKKVRKEG